MTDELPVELPRRHRHTPEQLAQLEANKNDPNLRTKKGQFTPGHVTVTPGRPLGSRTKVNKEFRKIAADALEIAGQVLQESDKDWIRNLGVSEELERRISKLDGSRFWLLRRTLEDGAVMDKLIVVLTPKPPREIVTDGVDDWKSVMMNAMVHMVENEDDEDIEVVDTEAIVRAAVTRAAIEAAVDAEE